MPPAQLYLIDTVSWSHRNHYIRFGVQLPQFSKRAVDDHTNRLGHDFVLNKAKGDKANILSAEISAFNVLNRANFSGYIGALNSSLFGQPTAAAAGRQLQFSVGYRF